MATLTPLLSLFIQERDPEYRLDGARNYLLTPALAEEQAAVVHKEGTVTSQKGNGINDEWRLKIAEWSYEVVDFFSFDREVVAIALNYIDRFMVCDNKSKTSKPVGKREYQLLTLTSLYLAIKLHGDPSDAVSAGKRLSLRVFVDLSQNRFTGADIEQMELNILESLRWRVHPPMSITFVKCFLQFLPGWHTRDGLPHSCQRMKCAIYERARYLTEISVCTSEFCFRFKPSLIAYAAILAAMDILERDPSLSNAFPPYQVLVDFFHDVFKETSLAPSMHDIGQARSMLIEMCPEKGGIETANATQLSANHMAEHGSMQEIIDQQYNRGHNVYDRRDAASPTEVIFAFQG
jgi:hypothetical protein